MNKVKCEVWMGFGLLRDFATIGEEPCTSCNGKGFFDNPDDSVDDCMDAAVYISTKRSEGFRK